MAVKTVLDDAGIKYRSVELGRADLLQEPTAEQYKAIHKGLDHFELEILDNKRLIMVEQIKNIIHQLIYFPGPGPVQKFTLLISQSLHYDYTYLSNVFSEIENSTIERYYLLTRIQRVKELIADDGKSLKEISYILNYSSVAHLCSQFKKITGQRPSEFKKLRRSQFLRAI